MRRISDELCRKYRLSVIDNPQPGKSKQYGEWRAEQEQRPTWRGMVRSDVDEAIREAMTERQFFENLRKKGYEIKTGKDISVRPPGKERFVRLVRNFGEDYTIEGIRKCILEQSHRPLPVSAPKPKEYHAKIKGDFRKTKKNTGFRALYLHYCYLLGDFPKGRKPNNKRIHFLLREDLIKLDAIIKEVRLLAAHHIDTAQQLSSYKSELEGKAAALTADRRKLYRQQRTAAVKTDAERTSQIKAQIAILSRELSTIRQEVKLCDNIAIRSGVMKEKIQAVREDSKNHGKEPIRDEQLRRRGGAGRQA